jgi:amidase
MVGPAVAGVLVAATRGRVSIVYWVDVASTVAALQAVIRLPALPPGEGGRKFSLGSIGEGLRFLADRQVIHARLLADWMATVFGEPVSLFPYMALVHFHQSAAVVSGSRLATSRVVAALSSAQIAITTSGFGCLLGAAALAKFMPALRHWNLEQYQQEEEQATRAGDGVTDIRSTGIEETKERSVDDAEALQIEDVREMAEWLGFVVDDTDAAQLPQWVDRTRRILSSLDALPQPSDEPPSRDYRWATREEDPLNAFISFCNVAGKEEGPLSGLGVAVKDCIAVAGLPLTDGGGREPYPVPSRDAVAVARLLDAGATVVGKTNMEDLAVGSGIGSHFGPSRNPVDPDYQTGGSSSGSAAAVGGGIADVGLGTDQAGSVRIPAAWCGLVGIKPTHGLVPTQGMSRMDPTLDHVGPMTHDVATSALTLSCLTGQPIVSDEGGSLRGLRLGIVSQSVHNDVLTEDVRRAFDDGVAVLARLGAAVGDADVPLWGSSLPIFTGVVAHGTFGTWTSGGCGFGVAEDLDERVVERAPRRSHLRSGALPGRVLTRLLFATYAHRQLGGRPIVRALNARMALRRQVDACLERFDLLMTPTVCKVADPIPAETPFRESLVFGPGAELVNTVPLDLTGHPALTLPCGEGAHGLPVGLQLIGPAFGEARIYQVASALEGVLGLRPERVRR